MGWKEFLEINVNFSPILFKCSYAYLFIDQHNLIHSRIGGVDVSLSVDDLANILAFPSEGFDIYHEHLNSFEFYPEGE